MNPYDAPDETDELKELDTLDRPGVDVLKMSALAIASVVAGGLIAFLLQ